MIYWSFPLEFERSTKLGERSIIIFIKSASKNKSFKSRCVSGCHAPSSTTLLGMNKFRWKMVSAKLMVEIYLPFLFLINVRQ